jgi:hypothetical protein
MAAFDPKIHGSLPNGSTNFVLRMVFADTLANIAGDGKPAAPHDWHAGSFRDLIPDPDGGGQIW